MATKITVNEAMDWLKILGDRHTELVALRQDNAFSRSRHFGVGGDKVDKSEPVYSVTKLDALVTKVATEIRKLKAAIKASNATTHLAAYEMDESVLGNVEATQLPPTK